MSISPLILIMLLAFLWLIVAVLSLWTALSPKRRGTSVPRATREEAEQDEPVRLPERRRPAVYPAPPEPNPVSPQVSVHRAERQPSPPHPHRASGTKKGDAKGATANVDTKRADRTKSEAPPQEPEKRERTKESEDAFERFLRSKNDDFDF